MFNFINFFQVLNSGLFIYASSPLFDSRRSQYSLAFHHQTKKTLAINFITGSKLARFFKKYTTKREIIFFKPEERGRQF